MLPDASASPSYRDLFASIKQEVRAAQTKAALSVSSALIQLYWKMGKMIADNQALFEGRNNYVEQLANDLRNEFPEMKGFSRTNLFSIRKFYQFYATTFSVQQLVGLNFGNVMEQPMAEKEEAQLDSVQQAVRLNLLFAIPWGHRAVRVCPSSIAYRPCGHGNNCVVGNDSCSGSPAH